ncbi:MAG TPA: twin-arginine translocase subunit TatC [Verrucomicrobiae bacterium]|nr:twin-arginine translocase subunit TatC [Verrucomicrobiae bacterium]
MATPAASDRPLRQRPDDESGGTMSFFDHLVELRKRIISSLLAIGVGMIVGLMIAKRFIYIIITPELEALRANGLAEKLYYTHPAGGVSLIISLGLYLGIIIAMPWVLYQVWLFVAPGLYKHERRAVASFIGASMLLFITGIAFGYFLMLRQVLTRVIGLMNDGPIQPLISVNEYFDLIVIMLVGLGVIFEMPVIVFILSLFRIVTPRFLLKNFRYAMLVITIIAAVVTPTPDATTMIVFMVPMVALYFVSVLVSYFVIRRKARAPAEEQAPQA